MEDWNRLFDKSKASKVPQNFPGDAKSATLQLEDVLEEVTDEVDSGSSRLEQSLSQLSTSEVLPRYAENIHKNGIAKHHRDNAKDNKMEQKNIQHFFKKPINEKARFAPPNQEIVPCREKSGEKNRPVMIDLSTTKRIENVHSKQVSCVDEHIQICPPVVLPGCENTEEKEAKGVESASKKLQLQSDNLADGFSTDVGLEESWQGKPISMQAAKALRTLLFGSTTSTFGPEWRKQGIRFNRPNHYALRYHKGALEGVMACIQAFVLKHVLFDEMPNIAEASPRDVRAYHKKCLILALSDILWQAGDNKKAIVCLPGTEELMFDLHFKQDGLLEKLEIFEFAEEDDLQKFISDHLNFFEDEDKSGCVLFIYSVMLSRTTQSIKEDLAGPNENLLGISGECNQSLVNLLLVGIATNNVFNNSKEVTDDNRRVTTLYGINKRSTIGFLSYEEADDPKKYLVGSMLKTPVFPIWLIFCNNHICVLFCRKRNLLSDWKLERRFDLYYFAGISRHFSLLKEDIRLTIDTIQTLNRDDYDYEFNSSLEDTIRTKWEDCVINWNGFHRF